MELKISFEDFNVWSGRVRKLYISHVDISLYGFRFGSFVVRINEGLAVKHCKRADGGMLGLFEHGSERRCPAHLVCGCHNSHEDSKHWLKFGHSSLNQTDSSIKGDCVGIHVHSLSCAELYKISLVSPL